MNKLSIYKMIDKASSKWKMMEYTSEENINKLNE